LIFGPPTAKVAGAKDRNREDQGMRNLTKAALAAVATLSAAGMGFAVGHAQGYQPRMQNALADLRAARDELRAAEPNKGGHRAEAIRLVNAAIDEVRAGMAAARNR
jgi:hypothetical protein